jgi:hypothetical protein
MARPCRRGFEDPRELFARTSEKQSLRNVIAVRLKVQRDIAEDSRILTGDIAG